MRQFRVGRAQESMFRGLLPYNLLFSELFLLIPEIHPDGNSAAVVFCIPGLKASNFEIYLAENLAFSL